MTIEIVLKYILCYAVSLLVFPTTFANEAFPPTTIRVTDDNLEYKSIYTLPESCDFSSPYRTIDGSCNNEYNPLLGKSFTPFKRFLPPDYSYIMFPENTDSQHITKALFQENTRRSVEREVNIFFSTFGQFLLHDLAFAQTNDENVTCCPIPTHITECMPNNLQDEEECSNDDPPCRNFVRHLGVGQLSGKYGDREQLNSVTHYLDGSIVYGSTKEDSDSIRELGSGKLKVTNVGNNPLLPLQASINPSNNCPLFKGGDQRVNTFITVTSHHIFWVREHNAIVDGLRNLHHDWNGEKLFQEARRIVIAEFQHIAYEEFLPLFIGPKLINYLNFTNENSYQPGIDGSTANILPTAAFRQAHFMLDDYIFFDQKGRDPSRRNTTGICKPEVNSLSCDSAPTMTISEALTSADRLFSCENSVDALIMGTIKQPAQISNDLRIAKSLKDLGRGQNLIGIDIERGRDHGIPSYTAWRDFCGLDTFTFDANSNTHKSNILKKLQSVYETEDVVDLYVGASLENKLDGAVLGPTYACIIAMQMYDTKYGDRFWYQLGQQFTNDQLKEISRQTMSMILMRNTNISPVPVNPFVIFTESADFQTGDATFNFTAWE